MGLCATVPAKGCPLDILNLGFLQLLKWEASFQGRPPTALGDLGGLDGGLDGGIKGVAETQVAGQASWPRHPLGSLEPSGLPMCQQSQVVPK